jgi:hypothetical protein
MTTPNEYFWNPKRWSIELLPVPQKKPLIQVHPLAALPLTAILGLAFLMFLPLIGFYLVAKAAVVHGSALLTHWAARTATQEVTPGSAYLVGRPTPPGASQALKHEDPALDKVEHEVQVRRGESKS